MARFRIFPSLVVLAIAWALPFGCAQMQGVDFGSILEAPGAASQPRVASGLREALRVGTERAVSRLSQQGGFSGVPRLRLGLPDDLQPVARSLRAVGLGGPVDDLERSMNRAAETAAGQAVPVFADAIAAMSITDALRILNGPDDAATRYFEARTSAALRTRFQPVVDTAMRETGVYRAYGQTRRYYDALPLAEALGQDALPDLQSYVLDRTLTGLFGVLAEEEARIRDDPAARTTALLREVFGQPGL